MLKLMSSLNQEPDNIPKGPGHLDSGLDSLINPLSGSFGEVREGYPSGYGALHCESDDEDDQAYVSLDTPLSLQPASLQPLTTIFDSPLNIPESDGDPLCGDPLCGDHLETSKTDNSGVGSSEEFKGSSSTHTVTSAQSATCDVAVDLEDHGNPDIGQTDQEVQENSRQSDDDVDHGGVAMDIQDEENNTDNEESITELSSQDDVAQAPAPSSVLSHVRVQPVKAMEIIIRTPVVESHPELISERVLVERAPSPAPSTMI